ncbi:MAG: glutamate--tRNA ligase [Parvularculaceae bacterium]
MTVKTRFAPSPTGFLHIGGARTALFNWLYARGRGGAFYLRIEDTDRARHSEAAVEAILDGLAWLGLDYDGAPLSQYARRERHAEAASELLARGAAYRCYLTPEELQAARDEARARGVHFSSPWRDRDPEDGPRGAPHVIRFKAPREGETVIPDAVQGDVRIANAQLDDLVLLRSDGAPTYMLAVVVDDHDMEITHVIRGDDHLTNAARQIQIYKALGWTPPEFAHIPLIHGPDGAKLSKRHGALGVEAYRDLGFLPEALCNYLLRLGWSHGDDEIISREQALEWFDLDGVGRAPARLDLDKLASINQHYMRVAEPERLIALIDALDHPFAPLSESKKARLRRAMGSLVDRAKTVPELVDAAAYLLADRPLEIEGKAAKPLQKDGARELLAKVAARLEAVSEWNEAALDAALQEFIDGEGLSFGRIGPPLRAALTGGAPAPGLGAVMKALGRDESLARIRDQAAPSD